jgi:hypothetical protein
MGIQVQRKISLVHSDYKIHETLATSFDSLKVSRDLSSRAGRDFGVREDYRFRRPDRNTRSNCVSMASLYLATACCIVRPTIS